MTARDPGITARTKRHKHWRATRIQQRHKLRDWQRTIGAMPRICVTCLREFAEPDSRKCHDCGDQRLTPQRPKPPIINPERTPTHVDA
jgi:hypothetical protein